ncbi:7443_t:CDS:2 [Diversispora eburnea]|uniref:7443_t:CDS:1 n=1 Tax=Diversispora eburnea TaxID=1213867 RepID=A0A9N9FI39_9GLOM|nr:7443_t:CDS:2 [Diversispora eburnea]
MKSIKFISFLYTFINVLFVLSIDSLPNLVKKEDTITPYYYDQYVDHFNKNSGTFKQKYFVNSTFYKPGAPIFIALSGFSEIAASFNGLMILVEHRFYGESYPSISNFATKNVEKIHTIEQALADFANFIANPPNVPIKIQKKSKWIFVGGSYSGNIATWMRKKYPSLVFAAWASSAPLLAKLDFFEYDQVVGRVLPCREDIITSVEQFIDPILHSGDRIKINSLKNLFGLSVLEDDQDFASALTKPITSMVQTYFPPTSPQEIDTIPTFCKAFDDAPSKDPAVLTAIYAQIYKYFLVTKGFTTNEAILKEFATPQPPLKRLRSSIVNIAYYQKQCNYLFPEIKSPQVEKFNKVYGGNIGEFPRTIFTIGENDPWTPLTIAGRAGGESLDIITKNIKNNYVYIIVNGSHVNDLRFPTPQDSESLLKARIFVKETLAKFIKSYKE